jgi:cytochrome c peroxidase
MCFCDATVCFQHWQSCSSCHPDGRTDGLNWDLLNDGEGNPKNTKSMLLAHRTPPAMARGVRPTAEEAVRSGITHIEFGASDEGVAAAIDAYLKALEPVPSPHLVGGGLSEAARRGKELFFREEIGCAKCHPAPLYTDMQTHDVGTQGPRDGRSEFDTPTLIEVWRTAPYLHDGRSTTIKELIVEGKHGASEGHVDQLGERQVDDLVEFVLSL